MIYIRAIRPILPLVYRHIRLWLYKAWISRPHDLVAVDKFFHAVSTPANHTSDGEQRCVQRVRNLEHLVEETTVIVDIYTYTLVYLALLGYNFRGDSFDEFIELKFILFVFFLGELFNVFLYD